MMAGAILLELKRIGKTLLRIEGLLKQLVDQPRGVDSPRGVGRKW